MSPTTTTVISQRGRAVLQAVAAGRCAISAQDAGALVIDGLCCCDQFVGLRLTRAGLIAAGSPAGPAQLTASGWALLEAA